MPELAEGMRARARAAPAIYLLRTVTSTKVQVQVQAGFLLEDQHSTFLQEVLVQDLHYNSGMLVVVDDLQLKRCIVGLRPGPT